MKAKQKKLIVARDISTDEFVVSKATNSTEYLPGQRVKRKQIEELCASHAWTVDFIHISKL